MSGEVAKPSPFRLASSSRFRYCRRWRRREVSRQAANRGKVRVLRPILGTSRRAEIDIDLNRVYAGKDNDFPLLPNDVLYVPRDSVRAFLVPVGTSLLTTLPYLIVSSSYIRRDLGDRIIA